MPPLAHPATAPHDAAQAIRNELRDLYLALEAGKISEADFDAREGALLDRLDALESPGKGAEDSLSPRERVPACGRGVRDPQDGGCSRAGGPHPNPLPEGEGTTP